tara:strand:+ start:6143 stop:6832 length:690 start_codon:yes stop_codon:yes gene_type:complete
MTLIEKLKAALKAKGLSEGLADIVSITEESEIATIVEKLSGVPATTETALDVAEVLASPNVAAYIKANGFDALLKLNKTIQSEHDKKVAQGITTFKTKLLGEDTPPTPVVPTVPATDDMPSWAKVLLEKVSTLENQKTVDSKSQLAAAALEKSNIPPALKKAWLSRINLESEISFDEQAKTLESEYKTIHVGIVGDKTYEFATAEEKQNNGGKMSDVEKAALTAAAKKL